MFDLLIIGCTAFVIIPLVGILAAVTRIKLGSPIFFSQRRPGFHGRPFMLVKFRTMTNECDKTGNLLEDDARITPFGQWLRHTSFDELPELFNILKGEMSLVGPRPLLMQYMDLYTPQQMRRHEVRPGLTGWAQVHGRVELDFEDRFDLDVWYVEHLSLWLDIKILLLTVIQVLRQEGITGKGYLTSGPVFTGTEAAQNTQNRNV